jgi:RNA polymerase sigma-70 factor (ECF subfamily)
MSLRISDEKIIEKVKSGNIELYGKIVSRYQAPLERYVKRVTNQGNEEIEDIVQDVLVKAYENVQGFNEGKKFGSWLYGIAHNTCIDFFRKNKLKTNPIDEFEEILPSKDKLIEELLIEKEKSMGVARAVSKLELKYREVILLYFYEDKSYEEIGDILKINKTNVGVLLMRAKEKLKRMI